MEFELARRCRPDTLGALWGNKALIDSLDKTLSRDDRPQAYLFTGPAGCGKAQPLDSLVLTPNGFVPMGDIEVGDKVIDGNGHDASVLGVFPQGMRSIYRITFNDRTSIRVADEHINQVYTLSKKRECIVENLNTLELLERIKTGKKPLYVKLEAAAPVEWEHSGAALPVHPYLLGILLADGCFTSNRIRITIAESDVERHVNELLNDLGYELHQTGKKYDFDIRHIKGVASKLDLVKWLRKEELLNCKSIDKHIPLEYLHASIEDRLELLHGLFDGDGYTSSKGYQTYSTCSKSLSDGFAYLLRSLGGLDTVSEVPAKYRTADGMIKVTSTKYTHFVRTQSWFTMGTTSKHVLRQNPLLHEPRRRIVSMELEPEKASCRCIYVNSRWHTYMTDNFTVTHNTTLARIVAKRLGVDELDVTEINASSHNGVDDIRSLIEDMQYASFGDSKMYVIDEAQMLTAQAQSAFLKPLEEPRKGLYIALCTTDPQKLSAAIRSRCVNYQVSRLSEGEMLKKLKRVNVTEELDIDVEVLEAIAEASEGTPRVALKLMDKAVGITDVAQALEAVKQGTLEETATLDVRELCKVFLSSKPSWREISAQLSRMKGSDTESIRRQVLGYMNVVLLSSGNPRAAVVIGCFCEPFFNAGAAGLAYASFGALNELGGMNG